MDGLLKSRLNQLEEQAKLENLSPEKFGKGAFANLTYTPSRLADNVLYKEANTLKKHEESNSRLREIDAFNNILKDRLNQLEQERNGIESTLTQQIKMYKQMLQQIEIKHEQRVKDIQRMFNEQIQLLIAGKEEEAKYAQSQKQLLQNRINELQNLVGDLRSDIAQGDTQFEQLTKEKEKLQMRLDHSLGMLAESEKKCAGDAGKANKDIEELNNRLAKTEEDFRIRLENAQAEKLKEREALQRLHRETMERAEVQRQQQAVTKSKELRDLSSTFEAETNRLNAIIVTKEKNQQALSSLLADEKQKLNEIERLSSGEIKELLQERVHLKEELQQTWRANQQLSGEFKAFSAKSQHDIASLEAYIDKLKVESEKYHAHAAREKQRTNQMLDELQRELCRVKMESDERYAVNGENSILKKEIRSLKQLLMESSLEMQTCKEEFLRLGLQKQELILRLNEVVSEKEMLYRLKMEREEEARGWRDSYYHARR